MMVLSAIVRGVGFAASAPHLVQHGLRSAAWRTREGSLKLVIAGLLMSSAGGPSSGGDAGGPETGDAGATGVESIRRQRREAGYLEGGGKDLGEELEGKQGAGQEGRGASKGRKKGVPMPRGGAGSGDNVELVDEARLICDVGSLLTDERPEVSVMPRSCGFARWSVVVWVLLRCCVFGQRWHWHKKDVVRERWYSEQDTKRSERHKNLLCNRVV